MTSTNVTAKRLSAGSEIDSWCTRCKMDLGHRIVAMVALTPKRVICLTCASEHNYRAAQGDVVKARKGADGVTKAAKSPARAKTATKAGTKVGAVRGAVRARQEWEQQVQSGKPFRQYLSTERYSIGDLLRHTKFGDGHVVGLSAPNKLTIAFVDGERTLIHAAA
jgi:hypothetical protein